MAQAPEQLIVWRRMDGPGHDACGLWLSGGAWRLRGTAIFVLGSVPCWLAYEVCGDMPWRTRTARVSGWQGTRAVDLRISVAAEGRWRLNGEDQSAADNCADPDFSFTPATNLIPLRRLALGVGDEAEVPAAWLHFPDQRLVRLEQHYRRVARDTYHYRAPPLDFSASLQVSSTGFVTRYPGLWTLEAMQ